MGTAAKVYKSTLGIECDFGFFADWIAIFIYIAFFQSGDQFELEWLVVENLFCFFSAYFFADEIDFGLNDRPHSFFDVFKVFHRQRPGQVEIIVKAVFDGWPNGYFTLREFFQDCLSHDVGCRVSDSIQL